MVYQGGRGLKSRSCIFITSNFVGCQLGGLGPGPRAAGSRVFPIVQESKMGRKGTGRRGRAFRSGSAGGARGVLGNSGQGWASLGHIPAMGPCTLLHVSSPPISVRGKWYAHYLLIFWFKCSCKVYLLQSHVQPP